jgi:hypothetical protein
MIIIFYSIFVVLIIHQINYKYLCCLAHFELPTVIALFGQKFDNVL